jgi:hypothetical protein
MIRLRTKVKNIHVYGFVFDCDCIDEARLKPDRSFNISPTIASTKTIQDCITVCGVLLSRLYSEVQTPNEYLAKCISQEILNTESLEKELRELLNG